MILNLSIQRKKRGAKVRKRTIIISESTARLMRYLRGFKENGSQLLLFLWWYDKSDEEKEPETIEINVVRRRLNMRHPVIITQYTFHRNSREEPFVLSHCPKYRDGKWAPKLFDIKITSNE